MYNYFKRLLHQTGIGINSQDKAALPLAGAPGLPAPAPAGPGVIEETVVLEPQAGSTAPTGPLTGMQRPAPLGAGENIKEELRFSVVDRIEDGSPEITPETGSGERNRITAGKTEEKISGDFTKGGKKKDTAAASDPVRLKPDFSSRPTGRAQGEAEQGISLAGAGGRIPAVKGLIPQLGLPETVFTESAGVEAKVKTTRIEDWQEPVAGRQEIQPDYTGTRGKIPQQAGTQVLPPGHTDRQGEIAGLTGWQEKIIGYKDGEHAEYPAGKITYGPERQESGQGRETGAGPKSEYAPSQKQEYYLKDVLSWVDIEPPDTIPTQEQRQSAGRRENPPGHREMAAAYVRPAEDGISPNRTNEVSLTIGSINLTLENPAGPAKTGPEAKPAAPPPKTKRDYFLWQRHYLNLH